MAKTLIAEPITVAEAKEALRNSSITDATASDLISAARLAAENYTGVDIAQYSITAADGTETQSGYAPADVPRDIKQAMYWYIVCTFEKVAADEWVNSFYTMLYPNKIMR